MTETVAPLTVAPRGRYASWSGRVRRGFKSDHRALAALIRLFDLGLCPRPVVRWRPVLFALACLGSGIFFFDGVFTALALSDPAHPFATEIGGLTSQIFSTTGTIGLLVLKLIQSAILFLAIDLARLRGLRKGVYVLGLFFLVIGIVSVMSSVIVLISPPDVLPY